MPTPKVTVKEGDRCCLNIRTSNAKQRHLPGTRTSKRGIVTKIFGPQRCRLASVQWDGYDSESVEPADSLLPEHSAGR